jgi:hypothetical protein
MPRPGNRCEMRLTLRHSSPDFMSGNVYSRMRLPLILSSILYITASLGAQVVSVQVGSQPVPVSGCSAEIKGNRPKIYIANFFVTYGKKEMGRQIGNYIAERFDADGRFEVVPRNQINAELTPFFKNKKATQEQYLETVLGFAEQQKADCVVFGRISKKNNKVFFMVRMSSVTTGESARKVDTEVERTEAVKFLEGIGDSFVSYFVTAKQEPTNIEPAKAKKSGKPIGLYINLAGAGGVPFGFVRNGFSWAYGGSFEFGHKGAIARPLFFGVQGEYLQYYKTSDNFISLYGISSLGLLGIEYLPGKFAMQLVLYGGYQTGKLTGQVESVTYGYGVFMAGNRVLINPGENWGILIEGRYSLAIAGTTRIHAVGFSVGAQVRF